jgi:hypothetical protein
VREFEKSRAILAGVFLASFAILGWNAATPPIASAYVDPVAKIQDQDEALYGSISLEVAKHGDWMTPVFLGRYELVKPPLLYWLEAAGMKIIGTGRLAIRLPSLFAGAATVTLVFAWLMAEGTGLPAALTGGLLLLSSHLFFVLSRVGLTDALLTFATTLAMFALARDPRLASRAAVWTFGLASGAAIMTKGVAGLFPLLALAMFCVVSKERPNWVRLAEAVAISAAVAAPWHVYELLRHTRWFWAQYVLGEIVTNSLASPTQSTQETHVAYYLKRLIALDAPLAVAALAGLAATLKRTRTRVLLAWIAVVLAAALSFDYRNTSYLLPIFPALALLVAGAISKKLAPWTLALAALLFAGKVAGSGETWGLPFAQEAAMPSEVVLDRYASLKRGNQLILGDPDDEFYSACLNLPQVRYLYVDPAHQPPKSPPAHYALDFEYLGVTITASDFARLPELRPVFQQRLRDWDLDVAVKGRNPIATVILASGMDQVERLLRDHPEDDFFVPVDWAAHDTGVHQIFENANGRALLLSRELIQRREVIQRPAP